MTNSRWTSIYLGLAALMASILALLLWAVPLTDEGAREWTGQLIPGFWMAWTFPVALFFWIIASLLIIMTLLAIRYPETPRIGALRIETTRGDRLFISLLGSAFLHLGWLFFFGMPLWGALIVSLVFAAAVFRWV
jgi:predicted small integral membrane protein